MEERKERKKGRQAERKEERKKERKKEIKEEQKTERKKGIRKEEAASQEETQDRMTIEGNKHKANIGKSKKERTE